MRVFEKDPGSCRRAWQEVGNGPNKQQRGQVPGGAPNGPQGRPPAAGNPYHPPGAHLSPSPNITPVGAGPCACPDRGQPRGVAPTGFIPRPPFQTPSEGPVTPASGHVQWLPALRPVGAKIASRPHSAGPASGPSLRKRSPPPRLPCKARGLVTPGLPPGVLWPCCRSRWRHIPENPYGETGLRMGTGRLEDRGPFGRKAVAHLGVTHWAGGRRRRPAASSRDPATPPSPTPPAPAPP